MAWISVFVFPADDFTGPVSGQVPHNRIPELIPAHLIKPEEEGEDTEEDEMVMEEDVEEEDEVEEEEEEQPLKDHKYDM